MSATGCQQIADKPEMNASTHGYAGPVATEDWEMFARRSPTTPTTPRPAIPRIRATPNFFRRSFAWVPMSMPRCAAHPGWPAPPWHLGRDGWYLTPPVSSPAPKLQALQSNTS